MKCAARGDRIALASSREQCDMFAEKCTTNKLWELNSSLKMRQEIFLKFNQLFVSAVKQAFYSSILLQPTQNLLDKDSLFKSV
jgi:hypothetical protein